MKPDKTRRPLLGMLSLVLTHENIYSRNKELCNIGINIITQRKYFPSIFTRYHARLLLHLYLFVKTVFDSCDAEPQYASD